MDSFHLLIVFILIASTAFFVAAEFSIIRVRGTRINQLVEEGHKQALAAQKVTSNLDEYLSTCQLGITITVLGIGWLGEETLSYYIAPILTNLDISTSMLVPISFIISFSIITFLNVVVGELVPKTFAIQKSEKITLLIAKPLVWFNRLTYPIVWGMNRSARWITGLFGFKAVRENELSRSEDELRLILSESYESGEINQSSYNYVTNIFDFGERIAKEIMVPRTEMTTIAIDASQQEVLEIMEREKYTRYPVDDGDKDNIIGMIHIKDPLTGWLDQPDASLEGFVKPVVRVIESIPIHDLLLMLQKQRSHVAVLHDEYGGTAGMVTMEDIIEEIVGEIRDEFDTDEVPEIRKIGEGHYIFNAKLLISEVNELLDTHFDEESVDTIGGWFLNQKYEVELGDTVEAEGYVFTVKEINLYHILFIEVEKSRIWTESPKTS
ncbi:HlyC/CorC family transporter [Bacillus sp. V3B]|uniref:hemolysin family protein n=1 Tax=Bacillus sp. V3B TaxID=2804915 RepID=UPI00210C5DB5|nr:hemolysin family protein [Bacillus sp. V3B]MCQ6275711.1 HlyC/CorC family transporter [Bacillus sp. V3B]